MESMAEGMIKDLVASGHALADDMTGAPSVLVRCLAAQLEVQLVRANALAAENAGLKKSEVEFNEYCRHECEDVGDTWGDDFTETPATDAFLAEVRAQGADELAELYFTLAAHEANRYIADSWRESARFAKDHAAQIRQEAAK
ncbi:hypothetical protein LEK04_10165 [Salmonella enterica]|nr:hypothetical protein [Salmonella enterica]MDJ4676842.1 hypothetical protein [Salmonella enterica]